MTEYDRNIIKLIELQRHKDKILQSDFPIDKPPMRINYQIYRHYDRVHVINIRYRRDLLASMCPLTMHLNLEYVTNDCYVQFTPELYQNILAIISSNDGMLL